MSSKILLFVLLIVMLISGCGQSQSVSIDKKSYQDKTDSAQTNTTKVFETVPKGFRVVIVGSGNPKTEVGRGAQVH